MPRDELDDVKDFEFELAFGDGCADISILRDRKFSSLRSDKSFVLTLFIFKAPIMCWPGPLPKGYYNRELNQHPDPHPHRPLAVKVNLA